MDSLAKIGELVKATEFIGQSSGWFISFFLSKDTEVKKNYKPGSNFILR